VITRDDLLIFLKESLDTEERAIPLYARHLNSTLFFSGFDIGLQKKIEDMLLKLKRESEGHALLLKPMIDKIERSRRDVY
jgi:hypothetical protein